MKFYEYVDLMKDRLYAIKPRLGYKTAWKELRSNYAWPFHVWTIDEACEVVKLPLFHQKSFDRYAWAFGFTPTTFKGNEKVTDVIFSKMFGSVFQTGSFDGCRNLRRITIPKNVVKIEENAFKHCDNLEDIYYSGTLEEWKKVYIASEKHEVDFGEFYPGTPVQKIMSERLCHIPGNEALFRATIHFNCNLDELTPPGSYPLIYELMKKQISVTSKEFFEVKLKLLEDANTPPEILEELSRDEFLKRLKEMRDFE